MYSDEMVTRVLSPEEKNSIRCVKTKSECYHAELTAVEKHYNSILSAYAVVVNKITEYFCPAKIKKLDAWLDVLRYLDNERVVVREQLDE